MVLLRQLVQIFPVIQLFLHLLRLLLKWLVPVVLLELWRRTLQIIEKTSVSCMFGNYLLRQDTRYLKVPWREPSIHSLGRIVDFTTTTQSRWRSIARTFLFEESFHFCRTSTWSSSFPILLFLALLFSKSYLVAVCVHGDNLRICDDFSDLIARFVKCIARKCRSCVLIVPVGIVSYPPGGIWSWSVEFVIHSGELLLLGCATFWWYADLFRKPFTWNVKAERSLFSTIMFSFSWSMCVFCFCDGFWSIRCRIMPLLVWVAHSIKSVHV